MSLSSVTDQSRRVLRQSAPGSCGRPESCFEQTCVAQMLLWPARMCSKLSKHARAACLSIGSDVLCAAQTLSYAGVHMEDGNRLEDYHVPAVCRPLKGFGVGFLEHAAPGSPRAC